MNINEFINKREFLYHLTDRRNFESIKKNGVMLSTSYIIKTSNLSNKEKKEFIRNRRPEHSNIISNNVNYLIRDQRPISIVNLQKCLEKDLDVGDFLEILNNRVFFWPTISRLQSHFNRYFNENPIIIKVSSKAIFAINDNKEFCRLNSGATRSNSYLNGAPPIRGNGTFLPAEQYNNTVGSVAEVTFLYSCKLPKKFFVGDTPQGIWEEVNII